MFNHADLPPPNQSSSVFQYDLCLFPFKLNGAYQHLHQILLNNDFMFVNNDKISLGIESVISDKQSSWEFYTDVQTKFDPF